MSEAELRSAILLAILAFVLYPILPARSVDPWGLVAPRPAWVTVILIAALGFANYVLLKLYRARAVELPGFRGGLVNSTVTVAELATRARQAAGGLSGAVFRGVVLATTGPGSRAQPSPGLGWVLGAVVLLGVAGGLTCSAHDPVDRSKPWRNQRRPSGWSLTPDPGGGITSSLFTAV